MRRPLERVRYIGFRLKMFMLFFVFTVIISMIIGILLYAISAQMLRGQMQDTMYNNLTNLSRSFDADTQSVMDTAATLSFDTEILASVQTRAPHHSYEYYEIAYAMRKKLTSTAINNPIVKSVYVIESGGANFYKNDISRTYQAGELQREGPLVNLREMPENRWQILDAVPLVENQPEATLSIMCTVRNASMLCTDKCGDVPDTGVFQGHHLRPERICRGVYPRYAAALLSVTHPGKQRANRHHAPD